jgi:hypothetical protein
MDRKPWESHPELTAERLLAVSEVLRDVRHEALPYHEIEKGDTNWGLGTRVSERSWHALREAVSDYPWLKIIDPGRHFVFAIGGVPLRFYRGAPEKPNKRTLARQYQEIRQHQVAFEFFQERTEYFWRLAIETEPTGEVLRIVVAEMSERGDVRSQWEVPLERKISALGSVSANKPAGVELPPPQIKGKKGKLKLVHSSDK